MFWLFICLFILALVLSLFPFFVHSFRCSLVLLLYHCVHSRVFSFLHSSVPVFLVFLILYVFNSGLLGQYSSVSTIRGPIEAHYSVTLLFLGQNGAKKKIFQRSLGSPPIWLLSITQENNIFLFLDSLMEASVAKKPSSKWTRSFFYIVGWYIWLGPNSFFSYMYVLASCTLNCNHAVSNRHGKSTRVWLAENECILM